MNHRHRCTLLAHLSLLPLVACSTAVAADSPAARDVLWQRLEKYCQPPAEFAGQLGPYRSPLRLADGTSARTPQEWERRRTAILDTWHRRLGAWPPLVERPTEKRLETVDRQGYTQFTRCHKLLQRHC